MLNVISLTHRALKTLMQPKIRCQLKKTTYKSGVKHE